MTPLVISIGLYLLPSYLYEVYFVLVIVQEGITLIIGGKGDLNKNNTDNNNFSTLL